MANRFEQSTPPSIHDAYRGLPIGPGGVEPFIYRDRGRHRRGPVSLPWGTIMLALHRALSRMDAILRSKRSEAVSRNQGRLCVQRAPGTCP
ncbi:MAG: hypothetical protein ACR2RF_23845 [Geminicoccaceae bacterium]